MQSRTAWASTNRVALKLFKYSLKDLLSMMCVLSQQNRDVGNGHLRLALQIQPGQFKRRPQIGTQENGRTANTQLFSLDGSWNGKQQEASY
jgi:hypothetical protein